MTWDLRQLVVEGGVMALLKFLGGTRVGACVGLLSAALSLSPIQSGKAHAAEAWPSRVQANYKIEFNGFDVGTFQFNAEVSGQSYTATGDAKISLLLGVLSWQGASRTSGNLAADAPTPNGYAFDFAGLGKSGSVKMGFAGEAIKSLAVSPTAEPTPEFVPVRENHLKGVLDPLSAVMAMSRSASANPCGRKISIFDGRQRFDLILSYRRQERVADTRPTGQPGIAFVCRVKYVPIAGYKATDDTRAMAANEGIEISLRPIPSANLFVPHQITVPTPSGTAVLSSQSIDIMTPRNEQIALSN